MAAPLERDWFQTSKTGLAKIARRRGLAYVLLELVQNAWDTGAKNVEVKFKPVDGRPAIDIFVTDDDPDGFKNLSHAWTLFAESDKKIDPQKRGKFNMGEKLVLAVCESAQRGAGRAGVIHVGFGGFVVSSRPSTRRLPSRLDLLGSECDVCIVNLGVIVQLTSLVAGLHL